MTSALTPFLFAERNVRGAYVEIDHGVREMLDARPYAPDVRRLLGEAIAATALLGSQMQLDGRINLQFQGRGALKMMVTQVDQKLQVRGMAKAIAEAHGDFGQLMDGGMLALMLEPTKGTHRYQAVVEIDGGSLASALEGYFRRSEQLPTALCLAAGPARLSGMLMQRLPARTTAADDEHWSHLLALFSTLSSDELAGADLPTVLSRLFRAEDVLLFDSRPVNLACRCSHASISAMLLSLGREELQATLQAQGSIDVTCEFCGRCYSFSPAEINGLFAAADATFSDRTKH